METSKNVFEMVYANPGAVWTGTNPPEELVKIIESGKVKPCKVIDIGCGEGFYSIYLASKGFTVTGIDISEKAIKYAKQNSRKQGLDIKFIAMGITDLDRLNESFDFVLEWALMHHIIPSHRERYVKNVSRILNPGGKYLSVCFNIQSPDFGQPGKSIRIVPSASKALSGEKVYFSSLEELNGLFSSCFRIIESRVIRWEVGKPHIGNYFLMEKNP